MPTIPIHPPSTTASSPEVDAVLPQILRTPSGLAIVEIQGTIKSSTSSTTENTSSFPSTVGKLVFPYYDATKGPEDTTWQKRVHLYVGKHQRLTGEVRKLPKPLAVLRRRRTGTENDLAADDELEIMDIVYYKILFAHRPEPVGGGGSGGGGGAGGGAE